MDIAAEIITRLRSVCPDSARAYALHEPAFRGNEWVYVKECLDTGWVSSVGSFVDRFERELATYTGVSRAIAVVNGTAALHVSLRLLGVSPGDEVLVPTLTFVATANAVAYCGAIPHFIDSSEQSLGVDPVKLKVYLDKIVGTGSAGPFNKQTNRPIRALVVMHTFGHPVDIDPVVELCTHYGIPLIEDAAESLGTLYKGRHTGGDGRLSILSFNGNKTITTGGGGAILTNDSALASRAKHLTTTARVPHAWRYVHDEVGFNYRLPNLNAALGCAQVEQLPELLRKKRRLAEHYAAIFEDAPGTKLFSAPPYAESNMWLNLLVLAPQHAHLRDQILDTCIEAKLFLRPAWRLMHELTMYRECPRMDLSVAEDLERRILSIPSSPFLADSLS